MHPILFSIGNLVIYTHGVVAVIGIVLGAVLTYLLAKKENLNTEFFFDNVVFSVFFGILGARLAYFFIYNSQFTRWQDIFHIWSGGLISYGGFFLGGLCFWLLFRIQKSDVRKWFDLLSIGFFLGLFLGRIGDLFAGEYNGVFSSNSIPFIGAYNVVPASLYEAILCLIIFIVFYIIYVKMRTKIITGEIALMSILVYSLGRFIIDCWRSEPKFLFNLSVGQFVDAGLFIVSLVLLIYIIVGRRRKNETEWRFPAKTTSKSFSWKK